MTARLLTALAVAALCSAVAWVISSRSQAGTERSPSGHEVPLRGQVLWVDPGTPAAVEAAALARAGSPAAEPIRQLAERPTATWLAGPDLAVRGRVHSVVRAAAAAHALPVLVSYEVPRRDCGGYSSGGAGSGARYRRYIADLDAGIGGGRAIVVLEPDAVAQLLSGCLHGEDAQTRLALLGAAVRTLTGRPGRYVYIDAGHPGWVTNLRALAHALRRAGVTRAAGFALNVSAFESTPANLRYGHRLSMLLGGAHFVIDTSRNGNGPDRDPADAPSWCNPPHRAVGRSPTTATGDPLVDAYLWVKPPGDSDGSCRSGAPPAGQWSLGYALALFGGPLPG